MKTEKDREIHSVFNFFIQEPHLIRLIPLTTAEAEGLTQNRNRTQNEVDIVPGFAKFCSVPIVGVRSETEFCGLFTNPKRSSGIFSSDVVVWNP